MIDALRRLVTDAPLRQQMSIAGRAFAGEHYGIEAQADALAAVIRDAAAQPGREAACSAFVIEIA